MKFWDASAVVPLLTVQASTKLSESIFSSDSHMSVWWGTPIECASGLNRLEREGKIDSKGRQTAKARLISFAAIWNQVQASEALRESAERLVYAYDLRAGDALQLAAAVAASGDRPATLEMVCFDRRLISAAQKLGFRVLSN
jgi:predicted nucleic acid-binding protein